MRFSANAAMPFAASGPGEQLVGQFPHRLERLVAGERGDEAEHPLGLGDRPRRAGEDARAQLGHGRCDVGADVGDQADRACLGGVESLAGQHRGGDLAGRDPPEDRHRDDRRCDTDAHLGERERGRLVHDDEVTGGHEPDAAGAHRTVHGGDRRAFGVHQPLEDVDERPGVGGRVGAFLEVGAGAERRAFVAQHDHPAPARSRRDRCPRAARSTAGATSALRLRLRVERDRRDPVLDVRVHHFTHRSTVRAAVLVNKLRATQHGSRERSRSGLAGRNFYTSRRDRAPKRLPRRRPDRRRRRPAVRLRQGRTVRHPRRQLHRHRTR